MKITKFGSHTIFEFDLDGIKLLAVASENEVVDRTTLKALLNKGVIIDPSSDTNRKQNLNMLKIKNYFIDSGYYFENPEEYYKQCLGCGRKITFKEDSESSKPCCGGGVYVLPEWKQADRLVLKNLRVFKKK